MNVIERGRLIVAISTLKQDDLVELIKNRVGLSPNAQYRQYSKDTAFTPEEWDAIRDPLQYVNIDDKKLSVYKQSNQEVQAVTVIPFYRAELFDDIISDGTDLVVHVKPSEDQYQDLHDILFLRDFALEQRSRGQTIATNFDNVLPTLNEWLSYTFYLSLDRLINLDVLVVVDYAPLGEEDETITVQHVVVRYDLDAVVGDEDEDVMMMEEDYHLEVVSQSVYDGVYGTPYVIYSNDPTSGSQDDE